jgi:hypothetical protein
MSLMRRRRLERLEARQPRGRPWTDPFPIVMALWDDLQAVAAGKACWIPRPEREMGEAEQAAFELAMREYDMIHKRLTTSPPSGPRRSRNAQTLPML